MRTRTKLNDEGLSNAAEVDDTSKNNAVKDYSPPGYNDPRNGPVKIIKPGKPSN
jgi:hypothetical protein